MYCCSSTNLIFLLLLACSSARYSSAPDIVAHIVPLFRGLVRHGDTTTGLGCMFHWMMSA